MKIKGEWNVLNELVSDKWKENHSQHSFIWTGKVTTRKFKLLVECFLDIESFFHIGSEFSFSQYTQHSMTRQGGWAM